MATRVATTPVRTLGVPSDLTPKRVDPRPSLLGPSTVRIAGTDVHLTDVRGAGEVIARAVHVRRHAPLAVLSINLDHVRHAAAIAHDGVSRVRHLNLIDDAPIARQARRLTGTAWPRVAGSDLIEDVLVRAHNERWRIAVLGGSPETRSPLHTRVMSEWPGVRLIGHWTPTREELSSEATSVEIAAQIRYADVDIVVVGLGTPLQETWIDRFGEATGARVLLAHGAVVDSLAGRVPRVAHGVRESGLARMWRLMLEPKRLAKRYLVEGPPAYLAVRRSSGRQGA